MKRNFSDSTKGIRILGLKGPLFIWYDFSTLALLTFGAE